MSAQQSDPITITRALVELKTLDSRIQKVVGNSVFISYQCSNEENPKKKTTSGSYQKAMDLIEYRNRLKAAIVLSNARTTVAINGKTYTIAECIERKTSIGYEKNVLNEMKQQLANATSEVENFNQQVQKKLDKLMEVSFGSNQKTNADDMKTFSDNYVKSNRAELVDPMKLAEKIDHLEDEIVKFVSEVDLVLSESNATTRITV